MKWSNKFTLFYFSNVKNSHEDKKNIYNIGINKKISYNKIQDVIQ